jgi:hypothetical protein
MGSKRTRKPAPLEAVEQPDGDPLEDTALRSLDKAERAKLGMDAWEPSLLRELLKAHNRLPRGKA